MGTMDLPYTFTVYDLSLCSSFWYFCRCCIVGGVVQWLGRRSLAGCLFLDLCQICG